jgi:ABC-type uncharacterized transport system involved in gliding motility auxiliary subunit
MTKSRWITTASFVLLFVALVAVNVLAGLIPLRLDVTEQSIFTLSDGTRHILADLPDPVTVKLYVPDSVADAPVGVKTFSRKVRELLQEYQQASKGKLKLEVFDPKPDSEDEDWAARYGLTPARLPDGAQLLFGMVALSAGREAAVPFFDPRRERFLEYDVSQTITRVNQQKRAKVQVLSWLPVMGQPTRMGTAEGEWYFLKELRKNYDVGFLFPEQPDLQEIPDNTSLLVVINPKNVADALSYAIDQYLLRGGKAIVFTDPNARMDPASNAMMMAAESGSLDVLFKGWGIETDANKIVGDRTLATRVSAPNQGAVDFPLWISLTRRNLNHDLAITSELEEITLIDAGSFRPAKDFKYTFTPLFTSSQDSGLVDLATARFMGPLEISRELKTDNQARVLAALMTGKLATAFPAGPPKAPPAQGKKAEPAKPDDKPYKHPFLAAAEKETSVLLVGDADFIADRFSVQVVSFFGNQVAQPINDNLSFVLNAVEFMTGSQDLIHIRSRGQLSRPFTRLQAIQVRAAVRYQLQEQLLSKRLDEVKRKLTELETQKQPGQKLILSPAQLEEVNKFRREEAQVRQQLREVRRVLRQDIDNLGNWLLALNLLLMPLVVAGVGVAVILRRARRR